MITVLRLLHSFYTFTKEVILGKATLREAYRYDRRRVYILAAIVLSISLNSLSLPYAYRVTQRYFELKDNCEIVAEDIPEPGPELTGEERIDFYREHLGL